ncbi:MAG: FeoB-associated Cys-rich membrane protein [Polaribacter sp.]|nr:FeoB-associated Cys-rich membrane protein [Polaribacter sp.]MDG1810369.1 FeoB-associated Cys-rich membrane protein [Polaribacter sp.]MDG1994738.1 FeoB-associated Cys-rich membrane protein [Polaribacter sp.]
MQEIIAYIVLIIAVVFLLRKFVFKSKKNKKGCATNCGCA